MGRITSGIGLISGINTSNIIDQLMAIEQQPVTLLQSRIATANAQKQAYSDLMTKLSSLQQVGMTMELPSTFSNSTATSSDQSVLTATAGIGAAVGSYQFQVARMVTSQQSVSNGFASTTSLAGAGTLTVSLGGGDLATQTTLAQLNGGNGIQRGQFRITDRSGKTGVIDISSAVTLDDVVKKINTSLDINVHATIDHDHLVLTDTSGQTSSNLVVQDLGDGTSATDLGISGNTNSNTLTGTSINTIGSNTALATLNDGRGLRTAGGAGADFRVTLGDGSTVDVNLGSAQTVGDVIKAINTAGGSKLKAAINTANNSIDLSDTSGGAGTFSVASLNGSQAAQDLGFTAPGSGGTIQGSTQIAGIDSVLVSSLNGGSGLPLGQISIQDRSGTSKNVDLSGEKSVQDILDAINNSGASVKASLNSSGNGIQIQDTSGGSGNLVIGDVNSTTAQALGISGTFDSTVTAVNGANLHEKWISENTLLSTYNGGKGVTPGSFTVTNSNGASATIDLTQGTFTTLGDVIKAINAKQIGVTASINSSGNGLLLTDTAGGSSKLAVTNVSGTTANDLNIAGTATGTTIDGSFEKTISVSATDTLQDVQSKVQSLGWGLSASIVNDGSGVNGYHLALTATNTGRAGRVVIDGGTTNIQMRTLVQAQDAAVFYGGAGSGQSMLVTSSSNQLTGVIPGVTIQLQGVSSNPVTLNVTRDSSSISKQLQTFTDWFNGIVDQLNTLTQWDSTKNQGGLLLGDSTVLTVEDKMYTVFNSAVKTAGQYKTLADVGLTLGDGAKITFDQDKFNAAYAADPTAVKNLFTQAQVGLGWLMDQSMKALVDPVDGAITIQNQTLDNKVQQFQDQITHMNDILANKRSQLEQQFANMETVLAGLQGQQAALGTLSMLSVPKTSTSSGSSSSSSSSSSSGG